jgi:hypothetical protein
METLCAYCDAHVDRFNSYKGGSRGKYTLAYFEDLWGMEYSPE